LGELSIKPSGPMVDSTRKGELAMKRRAGSLRRWCK
jgi:hypothetical protein